MFAKTPSYLFVFNGKPNMIRMVLTVQQARVYGKVLNRGDEFEVPEKEARLWGALARAKRVERVQPTYATAAVQPEEADNRAQRRNNRYNRRDMRAED